MSAKHLQITCYFDSARPEWMDGCEKQKEMADRIKGEVKSSASCRRAAANGLIPAVNLDDRDSATMSDSEDSDNTSTLLSSPDGHPRASIASNSLSFSAAGRGLRESSLFATASEQCPTSSTETPAFPLPPASNPSLYTSDIQTQLGQVVAFLESEASNLGLIMTYLDYVFPFLYPFYTARLLHGGRGWLLVFITGNQALYHITLCLGAYFVYALFDGSPAVHGSCKAILWERLQKQMDTADSARVMDSVVQLLSFEIGVFNSDKWQIHLDAALALFEQIFEHDGMDGSRQNMSTVLERMGTPFWAQTTLSARLWNADQTAFCFFSAILIVDDVIASTTLEQPPRLRQYHASLLTQHDHPLREVLLDLEDFIGCQNWVVVLVGEIATLDAWKKERRKAGSLSVMQLAARAAKIKKDIQDGLLRPIPATQDREDSNPLDVLVLDRRPGSMLETRATVTRIWAHAALIYLFVVVSGWQLSNSELRANVSRTLELFARLPSPACRRALVWPFCVAGCVASPTQEAMFREMGSAMESPRVFGTLCKALDVMESVWRRRDACDAESWDFAACFKSLGHKVLLV